MIIIDEYLTEKGIDRSCKNELDLYQYIEWLEKQVSILRIRPLSFDAVLADVMAKIRKQSLFVDSSTIEIDDAVLEEILSHYFA